MYGLFWSTARNLRAVERETELRQTARVVLGDLRRELESVYPMMVPADDSDPEQQAAVTFAGEDAVGPDDRPADNLRFTCTTSRSDGAAGYDVIEVMYLIDDDPATPEEGLVRRCNARPGLAAEDSGATDEQLTAGEVAPEVTSFDAHYLATADADATAEESWVEDWSAAYLPVLVELTIGLTPPGPDAVERRYTAVVKLPMRYAQPLPGQQRDGQAAESAAEPAEPAPGAQEAPSGMLGGWESGATLPGGGTGTRPGATGGPNAAP